MGEGTPGTATLRGVPGSSAVARFLRWLRAHPILCLALLTPGIPEYLSTSSAVIRLFTDPTFFFFQLAINVGQYTGGALLIREAMIRWRKGWGSVVLLALAYGITEEGLGDNTLFNSSNGRDGTLGSFGHFAGVNWVWAAGVLAFHVIYSIGIPLIALRLALPETAGRSLLGRRGIAAAFASLIGATGVETAFVYAEFAFWMGTALFVGCLVVITALVLAARRLPSGAWTPLPLHAAGRPWQFALIGFACFPAVFAFEDILPAFAPAIVVVAVLLVLFGVLFEWVRRHVGQVGNEYLVVDLIAGFVLWQCVFGVLLTLPIPYTLPLVALAAVFLLRLRRRYPTPHDQKRGPVAHARAV